MATLYLDRAKMQLISGFVDTYLELSTEEEELFRAEIATIEPSEREVVMQIVTSWMREGIEQGLQQGRQEGELAIILRLLNRRIGTINSTIEERLRKLSLTQLEDLAEVLLDFSTEADLVAWLQSVFGDNS